VEEKFRMCEMCNLGEQKICELRDCSYKSPRSKGNATKMMARSKNIHCPLSPNFKLYPANPAVLSIFFEIYIYM
jgi:hypothetical protein